MPSDPDITTSLDATGHRCPLPVLMARKALAQLGAGAVLEVLADDPAAQEDFDAFCRFGGHRLVSTRVDGAIQHFLIEKAAGG